MTESRNQQVADQRLLSVGAVLEMVKLLFARSDKYCELQHSACLKYMASVIAITPGLYYLYVKDQQVLVLALAALPVVNAFFMVMEIATAMSMVTIRQQIESLHDRLDTYLGESPIRAPKPQWAVRNVALSMLMLGLPMGVSAAALYGAALMSPAGLASTVWWASTIVTGALLLFGLWETVVCCRARRCLLACVPQTADRSSPDGQGEEPGSN